MSKLSFVRSVECLTMNYMNILIAVVDILFLPFPEENMTNSSCFVMQKLFQDMLFKILTLTAHGKWPTQQVNFVFPGAPIYQFKFSTSKVIFVQITMDNSDSMLCSKQKTADEKKRNIQVVFSQRLVDEVKILPFDFSFNLAEHTFSLFIFQMACVFPGYLLHQNLIPKIRSLFNA